MTQGTLVIVAPALQDGGSVGAVAWRHALELSRTHRVFALSRNVPPGHHANITALPVHSKVWDELRRLAHVPNELSFLAGVRRELQRLAQNEAIDTVWCHSHAAVALAAAPLREQLGYRIVMTTHGDIFDRPAGTYSWDLTAFYKTVTRRAYRESDRVHVLSPYMAECAVRGGAMRTAVNVIPNGIDAQDLGASALAPRRANDFMPDGALRLLYVGSLWAVKGVDVLVRAVSRFNAESPVKAELTLVGEGPAGTHLHALVASQDMADTVKFMGRIGRQQLAAMYAQADVLCIPSLSEALPTVALEAMVCGLPVVGSNTGGIPMLVHDGVTGHLAVPGDVTSLVDALRLACTSREHLATLGASAYSKVRTAYTWPVLAASLRELLAIPAHA